MITLTQMEYVVAVATQGSFSAAAKKCFVTQPTLSMQIQKLEDYLELQVFDRTRKPIEPTVEGLRIVNQAKILLQEAGKIAEIAADAQGKVAGVLQFAIIPTLAPLVLPRLIPAFQESYPNVSLNIREIPTNKIMSELLSSDLDVGLLATPLHHSQLTERRIFDEKFYIFHSKSFPKELLNPPKIQDLPLEKLLLMADGHCLKNQTLDLCKLNNKANVLAAPGFHFESGSLQTLISMVETGEYFTILPGLCLETLSEDVLKDQVCEVDESSAFREVSLVTYRKDAKKAIIDALFDTLLTVLPKNSEIINSGSRAANQQPLDPVYHI